MICNFANCLTQHNQMNLILPAITTLTLVKRLLQKLSILSSTTLNHHNPQTFFSVLTITGAMTGVKYLAAHKDQ